MSTGDLKNNIKKLQSQLKTIKYSGKLDLDGIRDGSPTALLPLFHYVFTSYSHRLNRDISNSNNELYGKSDLRFMEAIYKILRDMFSYKPPVTREQFFQAGFAERKIIMAAEILRHVQAVYSPPASTSSYKLAASKLDRKQQDIHAKIQSSAADSHQAPGKTRKVAGRPVANLAEAIVLPRYVTSSSSTVSSRSHDRGDGRASDVPTPTPSNPDRSHSDDGRLPRLYGPHGQDNDVTDPVSAHVTQHITHALAMLNTQVGKISTALEKVESQIASNPTSPRSHRVPLPVPPAPSWQPDKHQMETLVSKVILLENRMTLLENKVEDVQAFCTILLEDRSSRNHGNNNTNNNNKTSISPRADTPHQQRDNDNKTPCLPINPCGGEDKVMHPDYVKAFAPVRSRDATSDPNVERTAGDAVADDDGDADDDVTIEEIRATDAIPNGDASLHGGPTGQTGHMHFMKALVGPHDSDISLSRDQDDSTASLSRQPDREARTAQEAWMPRPHPSMPGVSPIRGPLRDASMDANDGMVRIPYGLEDEGFESRRLSSTPNKGSGSGDDLDTSTMSRVHRIMQMMKDTQDHFHQSS